MKVQWMAFEAASFAYDWLAPLRSWNRSIVVECAGAEHSVRETEWTGEPLRLHVPSEALATEDQDTLHYRVMDAFERAGFPVYET
jgi:hypothetical protein